MTLAEFQAEYGPRWSELVKSPMWNAALDLCDTQTSTLDVSRLSDVEIHNFSTIILARQQGYTEHARLLTKLAEASEVYDTESLEPNYPDPIEEFAQSQSKQPKNKI